MAAKTHILSGEPPVEVALKRNARARRFTLRVSRSAGTVSLSMPDHAPEAEALQFLESRGGWVRAQLARAPQAQSPEIGVHIPLRGQEVEIRAAQLRSARIVEGAIELPEGKPVSAQLKAVLKVAARQDLAVAVDRYAAALGRDFGRISLRDTRSRWGSCSSKGDLMFSWRLIMAPPDVLDYVAAHEVAHLAEMNHSPRFWAVCGQLYPGYEAPRDWLRRNGGSLLAWRF